MAIPTGAGTEVLKRHSISAQSTNATAVNWLADQSALGNTSNTAVPADHIITILTMTFCTNSGDAAGRYIDVVIKNDSNSDIHLFKQLHIPTYGTFVMNDKFVLYPGDKLEFDANDGSNFIWFTYIDQHF